MDQHTCILYFALTPDSDAKSKKRSSSKRINRRIAKELYLNSKKELQLSHLPIIEINEDQQQGRNFGEKISHAIQSVFDQNYNRVIVVGSDCINLHHTDALTAKQLANENINTIGFAKDGGAYLFSLQKEAFNKTNFENLPWCTKKLGQSLFEYLQKYGQVECLKTKSDADDERAFLQSFSSIKSVAFIALLKNIFLSLFYETPIYLVRRVSNFQVLNLPLRGPPCL